MVTMDPTWKTVWPQAHVGVMAVSGLAAPERCKALGDKKIELMRSLRSRFPDKESILSWHTMRAYADYFKRYKKTYHVLIQVESVACKGKALPNVSPVVEAMFMAELDHAILTAGHDVDALQGSVRLLAAQGGEMYEGIGGRRQEVKALDMAMMDGAGIIASVIGGPDERTKIMPQTRRCMFVAYAPAGIAVANVKRHLEDIGEYLQLFSPALQVEELTIFGNEEN